MAEGATLSRLKRLSARSFNGLFAAIDLQNDRGANRRDGIAVAKMLQDGKNLSVVQANCIGDAAMRLSRGLRRSAGDLAGDDAADHRNRLARTFAHLATGDTADDHAGHGASAGIFARLIRRGGGKNDAMLDRRRRRHVATG